MDAPLIERTRLFGNPSRSAGHISPDGRWLSWLAPLDGVMNIWVAPTSDPAAARAVTAETVRPIRSYFWAPDSAQVLFVNDQGGDENFKLYGAPAEGGEVRLLTPFDGAQTQILKVSPQAPDRILVGLNNRDPRWHDVYALDLAGGDLSLVYRNEGFTQFLVDQQLTLRGAVRARADGGMDFHRFEGGVPAAQPFDSVSLDDAPTTRALRYDNDGATLYWLDSRGRDTAALVAEDTATGERKVLGEDPRADILSALFDPLTGRAVAYPVSPDKTEWVALDESVGVDLAALQAALGGEITIDSRTHADDLWVVTADPVNAPPAAHLFERATRKVTPLYVTRPELADATLAAMHPVTIVSRDGLEQVSYLTLPPESDRDGSGRPAAPVPMVLLPHGGPWARDFFAFSVWHQFLANRGYAVLSPNFRGSQGFGKKKLTSGYLEWGRSMHDDLIDAVAWAVREGVAIEGKVGIMGGSYGGYCVLAGLAFTPDAFACGVDLVGPANLITLLNSMPSYWEAIRNQMYARVGDPRTEEGRAILTAASPLTRAGDIRRPLLIGQGANDPRVKQAESDQIVDAMEAKGIPVTYLLFPDEGHGFARPQNNIAFFAAAEQFLAECLGGRAEPFGDALHGSSMCVPVGAEHAPGLPAALAAAMGSDG